MNYNEMRHSELVQACVRSDADAWREFMSRFGQVISLTALRTANRWGNTSKAVLEDLIQEIYLKLCEDDFRLLKQFEFRDEDAIYGFLKVVTANIVHDHFRHFRAKKRGIQITVAEDVYLVTHGDPSATDHIQRAILIQEIAEALNAVTDPEDSRDRTIFWLYYRQGFTANAIADLYRPGLSTKGVESVLHRLTNLVKRHLTEKACHYEIPRTQKGVPDKEPF